MLKIDVKRPATKKEIYFWNSVGSMCNAAVSVLLLAVVIRVLGQNSGDVFSLGFSVATLMWSVAYFETVTFQATDVNNEYTFSDFFCVKIWLYVIAVAIGTAYSVLAGWSFIKIAAVFILCVYKCSDAFSGVYAGLLQKNERLDIAGKSCAFRSVISILIFTFAAIITRNLFVSMSLMTLFSLIWVFSFDVHYAKPYATVKYEANIKKMISITAQCAPLFIGGFVLNFIANEPKYVLERYFPDVSGIQSAFSAIIMPVFVINLLSTFMFRPIITKMAVNLKEGKIKAFSQDIVKMYAFIAAITALAIVAGYFLGIPVLEIFYKTGLSDYKKAFIILLLGGGASAVITFLYNVSAIMRTQKYVLSVFVAAFLSDIIICPYLVKRYMLDGAAYSYTLTMIFSAVLFMALTLFLIKSRGNE